jgi:hypothetical protein
MKKRDLLRDRVVERALEPCRSTAAAAAAAAARSISLIYVNLRFLGRQLALGRAKDAEMLRWDAASGQGIMAVRSWPERTPVASEGEYHIETRPNPMRRNPNAAEDDEK